ncbi:SdpI family protein [Flavobacterium sp. JP2137]|uniref:SdpI family protein n=1 Tax=Flavobacterium sp. JP2137 TaxID=3414510 RepID=UPI003D2FB764
MQFYCLLFAVLMLLFTLLSMKYTSKKRGFFGYKTSRSMKNDNVWNYANKIANRVQLINVMVFIIASFVLFHLTSEELAVDILMIFFAVASILIIPIVELCLSKKFDRAGNLK